MNKVLQEVQGRAVDLIVDNLDGPYAERDTIELGSWVAWTVNAEPKDVLGYLNTLGEKFMAPRPNGDDKTSKRQRNLANMFGESVMQQLAMKKSPVANEIEFSSKIGFGLKLVKN